MILLKKVVNNLHHSFLNLKKKISRDLYQKAHQEEISRKKYNLNIKIKGIRLQDQIHHLKKQKILKKIPTNKDRLQNLKAQLEKISKFKKKIKNQILAQKALQETNLIKMLK